MIIMLPLNPKFCGGPRFRVHRGNRKWRSSCSRRCNRRSSGDVAAPTVVLLQPLQHECKYVGNCQNYGPFLGPYYNTGPNTGPNLGDPKRDNNFDNSPCIIQFRQSHGLKSHEDFVSRLAKGMDRVVFSYSG